MSDSRHSQLDVDRGRGEHWVGDEWCQADWGASGLLGSEELLDLKESLFDAEAVGVSAFRRSGDVDWPPRWWGNAGTRGDARSGRGAVKWSGVRRCRYGDTSGRWCIRDYRWRGSFLDVERATCCGGVARGVFVAARPVPFGAARLFRRVTMTDVVLASLEVAACW